MSRIKKKKSDKVKLFVYGQLRKDVPFLEMNYRSIAENPPEVIEGVKTTTAYAMYHLGFDVGIKTPESKKEKKYARQVEGDVFLVDNNLLNRLKKQHFDYHNHGSFVSTYRRGRVEVRMPDGTTEEVTTFFVNPKIYGLERLPLVESYDPNGWVCCLCSSEFPDVDTLQFLANLEFMNKRFSIIEVFDEDYPLFHVAKDRVHPIMTLWKNNPADLFEFRETIRRLIASFYRQNPERRVYLFLDGHPAVTEVLARYFIVTENRRVLIPVVNDKGKIFAVRPHPFTEKFDEILRRLEGKVANLREIAPEVTQKDIEKLYREKLSDEIHDFLLGSFGNGVPNIIKDVVYEHFGSELETEQTEDEVVQRSVDL